MSSGGVVLLGIYRITLMGRPAQKDITIKNSGLRIESQFLFHLFTRA